LSDLVLGNLDVLFEPRLQLRHMGRDIDAE
jgi:hypothetical protein